MQAPLLDTDSLSEIMKGRNVHVGQLARAYLTDHGLLHFSILTKFEVLRGLYAKSASAQVARFESLCSESYVAPLSDQAAVEGARIWGELRKSGVTTGLADVLIGATALTEGRAVATRNVPHFTPIPGLRVIDWRDPS